MTAELVVAVVLAALFVEAMALAILARRLRLPPFRRLLPNLAAGLFLTLALASAIRGAGVGAIALFVALGGIAHLLDLGTRRVD